jgi:hypothetical protein
MIYLILLIVFVITIIFFIHFKISENFDLNITKCVLNVNNECSLNYEYTYDCEKVGNECVKLCNSYEHTECPEDRCQIKNINGENYCHDKPLNLINSECYQRTDENCENDDKCKLKSNETSNTDAQPHTYSEFKKSISICVPNIVCPSGLIPKFNGDNFICEPCPPGTFESNKECKECPKGQFSDESGLSQCKNKTRCEDNQFIDNNNQIDFSNLDDLELPFNDNDVETIKSNIKKAALFYKDNMTKDKNRTCSDLTVCPETEFRTIPAVSLDYGEKYDFPSISSNENNENIECHNFDDDQEKCNSMNDCQYIQSQTLFEGEIVDYGECRDRPIKIQDNICKTLTDCEYSEYVSNYEDMDRERHTHSVFVQDRQCDPLQTCQTDQFVKNYGEMEGTKDNNMYIQDRSCQNLSNCQTDQFVQNYSTMENTKDNNMYTQDRSCDILSSCNNDQFVQNYITMEGTKDNNMYTQDRSCQNLSNCQTDQFVQNYQEMENTKDNNMYIQDRSCQGLSICNNDQFVQNYNPMEQEKQTHNMYIQDRQCHGFSDCNPGTYIQYKETDDNPKIDQSDGTSVYTLDRTCPTCPDDHTYTGTTNMTACVQQPTFGEGYGTNCPADQKDSRCLANECKVGTYQDEPSHRSTCKVQTSCIRNQTPYYEPECTNFFDLDKSKVCNPSCLQPKDLDSKYLGKNPFNSS